MSASRSFNFIKDLLTTYFVRYEPIRMLISSWVICD
jgi:hypothetical protein